MMEEAEDSKQVTPEMEHAATQKARDRSMVARWDLNIAIFLFAVLIIVIILLAQDIGIEIVAPVAVFGLAMVWLVGWRRGRELYQRFYDEELAALEQVLKKRTGKTLEETVEETVEEQVQKAFRERLR